MKRILASVLLGFIILYAFSRADLDYYLPVEEYNADIPVPESILGHQPGEWHLGHDKLVYYLQALAGASDRIIYREYARSHEGRPLFHLIITSAENHSKLEEIRTEHLKLSDPELSGQLDIENMPVVVRMGYGVHGNESSASNSSVLVAWYLAASNSEQVKGYLDNMVILLDPCLNPDGFDRHASWINMHKSAVPMKDDMSRGFRETWPGGRTNHYWFDLNRDWILLQHPETRGRVDVFHNWKPNVQTDHHEMGSNSSFFFQPGVPGRTNPYTPQSTTELTQKIGGYHAEGLDDIGTLFFTEERFDDFYYGKGSSYPDVLGSVGILFEQAGTRGYERDTPRGRLSFPYAIRNQVKVSLSTLKASYELRKELLEHTRDFFRESVELYASSPEKAYVFGANSDPTTLASFLDVLLRHRIEVYALKTPIAQEGIRYTTEDSYIIPLNQPGYRLIQSLFKPVISFEDSLFYDISAWTLPYAFNIPYHALTSSKTLSAQTGDQVRVLPGTSGKLDGELSGVGYLFHWHDYHASRVLYKIQEAGLLTQVASLPIGYKNRQINKTFSYGSIFIPVEKQDRSAAEIYDILKNAVKNTNVSIYPLSTSYTVEGMDMGSNLFIPLKKPRILLLTGNGISSLDAGEIWHLLDLRMNIPLVLLDMEQLNSMDLSPYTHLIMPSGYYGKINTGGKEEIGRWLKRGGCIIALNSANQWLAENKLADLEFRQITKDTSGIKPYHEFFPARGAQRISGSIFEAAIDISHPIGYGLNRPVIPVYRTSTLIPRPVHRPYAVPLRYTEDPLLSGYVPKGGIDDLRNIPGIIVSSRGDGRVISFIDNPNFRGFWYGTNKLFMNAIFFGPTISEGSAR